MILFDRYSKLKKQAPGAAVYSGQKELLPLLSGSLRKTDLPELIVEPSNVEELQTLLRFAAEKDMRIAVASGHSPVSVSELESAMLILTHRLSGPSQLSSDGMGLWVHSGTPLETVAVELAQRGLVWLPLHPIEPGETMGTLFARAVEGVRSHRGGGVLSNLRRVEWVGYSGERYATGPSVTGDNLDVSSLLFGSGARYGVSTKFELALEKLPETRTLLVCECASVDELSQMQQNWRYGVPLPDALPFWTAVATDALRQGNDDLVSDSAVALLACEWQGSIGLESSDGVSFKRVEGNTQVSQMWQNLFRLPRTLARLHPDRSEGRFKLPAESLIDFNERVEELARDRSLSVAVWGTLDSGNVNVWVLHPDSEARTARRAAELLERISEDSLNLAGCPIENAGGMCDLSLYRDSITQGWELTMLNKCDPSSRYKPLRPSPTA
ncbi:MAG: FAD-binding oxidoreductase [Calditrichaeota bacterium]|nr:FAD-binding oxidoreductase [Calditrichota bacterium]MCB9367748.1 FAD-binding oxidoreductase [Calditrichota bacterium]